MGTQLTKCRLCGNQATLLNSHVIPEFLYAPLYELEDHRLLEISTTCQGKINILQKGRREPLLCKSDETLFSRWENYARILLFDGKINATEGSRSRHHFEICGVRYDQFKLFQLSILWRASVSTLPFFSHVNLLGHENRLRDMLLRSFPGDSYEYGCMMMSLTVDHGLFDSIRQPDCLAIDGFECIRFVMGGFVWVYVISQNGRGFAHKDLFLHERGNLIVLREKAKNVEFLLGDLRKLSDKAPDVIRVSTPRRKQRPQ